jgi:hypothetical protein
MSFMPEVKMDFIPDDMTDDEVASEAAEEMEEFNEEKDKTQEEIQEEAAEEIVKIPKAKSKRDDMNVSEIFNMPEAIPNPPTEQNVKLTKKGKPRKKRPPMSEEHKAKLALAREKAMAARKKKAQDRKDNKALELEEKELLKKQKVKRVKQLKEEVSEDVPPKKESEFVGVTTFTKKDLEEAQFQAIINYEKIRKQRKEKKKIDQEKNKEEEMLKAQLRRAVAPPQQEYNPFNGCY